MAFHRTSTLIVYGDNPYISIEFSFSEALFMLKYVLVLNIQTLEYHIIGVGKTKKVQLCLHTHTHIWNLAVTVIFSH